MKTFGQILVVLGIWFIISSITFGIIASYQYKNKIYSHWSLADKSSTIDKKAMHMDKFVEALENANLHGKYNALLLKTPDNNFDFNFEALQTLQQRLHEIEGMNVQSFEYQTAIQQITAQEQGEANEMLGVFKGVWFKTHYILLWNWICATQIILNIIIIVIGAVIWDNENY